MTKPFNLDEILSLIEKALSHSILEQENAQLEMLFTLNIDSTI